MEVQSAILARLAREEVRGELQDRLMPTIAAFLNEEIGTITSMISESSDEMQKAHLMRLCTDLGIIRQALDGVVAMSAALLLDR